MVSAAPSRPDRQAPGHVRGLSVPSDSDWCQLLVASFQLATPLRQSIRPDAGTPHDPPRRMANPMGRENPPALMLVLTLC